MTCIKVFNRSSDLLCGTFGVLSDPPRDGQILAAGLGTPILNPEMDVHGNQ
jgi:hypothetical protein